MPALILYLLKVNVALVLFYLAYYLVLRKLTFYHLNRLFLVFGILFSTLYSFIDLSTLFSQHQELAEIHSTYAVVIPAWTQTAIPEETAVFDYWLIPVALFWLGCGLMMIRLFLQFVSLYRIHRISEPASYQDVDFRKVSGISEAFSFWRTIYLNPTLHRSDELESILRHEQIHVKGWHTLDVLLAEVSTVFYWFNPGMWLMKKAMKENLEFIADQHVVDAGADRREYQYLLLKVVGATQPQIANQFNFPSLKRRIAMMNKMPTNRTNRLRLLVVLPLVTVLLVAFRSTSQNNITTTTEAIFQNEVTQTSAEQIDEYAAFYARNPEVSNISWKSNKKIVVALKSGAEEVYTFGDKQSMAAAELKYGEMPSTPPVARRDKTGQIPAQDPAYSAEEYEAFLKRNPDVKRVYWVPDEEAAKGNQSDRMVFELKTGGLESYRMAFKSEIAAAEEKYGKLPRKPARPPMLDNTNLPAPPAPYNPDQDERAKKVAAEYKTFYARNPQVRKLEWVSRNKVRVRLESTEEIYDLSDGKSRASAEEKYGRLPSSPPPAEVVTQAEFNAQKDAAIKQQQNGKQVIVPEDIDYYQDRNNLPVAYTNFLKRNPSVEKVGWQIDPETGPQAVILYLKSGATETYPLHNANSMASAKSKYGELPDLLPPPPPVRIKD